MIAQAGYLSKLVETEFGEQELANKSSPNKSSL
jgi:hypothetical protein